jgi:hypothetical protein
MDQSPEDLLRSVADQSTDSIDHLAHIIASATQDDPQRVAAQMRAFLNETATQDAATVGEMLRLGLMLPND